MRINSRTHAPRGATLIEAMATMVVLLIGILAISLLILGASKYNRRNLAAVQAAMVAERYLEQLHARGCAQTPGNLCDNVKAFDNTLRTVCWSASGEAEEVAADVVCDDNRRAYRVAVDVDGHGTRPDGTSLWEGSERGDPMIDPASAVLNVRVAVSWDDDVQQVVALQTRIAP